MLDWHVMTALFPRKKTTTTTTRRKKKEKAKKERKKKRKKKVKVTLASASRLNIANGFDNEICEIWMVQQEDTNEKKEKEIRQHKQKNGLQKKISRFEF